MKKLKVEQQIKVPKINSSKIKALRIEHGLKQEDMAEILGVFINTYNRKENGITEFNLSEAFKISKVFNKDIESIFFKYKLPNV